MNAPVYRQIDGNQTNADKKNGGRSPRSGQAMNYFENGVGRGVPSADGGRIGSVKFG